MIPLLLVIVGASLAGSLHSAGMCGPFVVFYAGQSDTRAPRRFLCHAGYQTGRLLTYTTLGAVAGGLGAALNLAGDVVGLQAVAAWLAGGIMVLWGLHSLALATGLAVPRIPVPAALRRFNRSIWSHLKERPPVLRAFLIGLFTTFLPCGWLYAFLVLAAGSGLPLHGAAIMAAFWLGAVPILLLIGVGVQLVAAPVRRWAPTLTALFLLAVGLLTLSGRLAIPTPEAAAAADNGPARAVGDQPAGDPGPTEVPEPGSSCCEEQ